MLVLGPQTMVGIETPEEEDGIANTHAVRGAEMVVVSVRANLPTYQVVTLMDGASGVQVASVQRPDTLEEPLNVVKGDIVTAVSDTSVAGLSAADVTREIRKCVTHPPRPALTMALCNFYRVRRCGVWEQKAEEHRPGGSRQAAAQSDDRLRRHRPWRFTGHRWYVWPRCVCSRWHGGGRR